MSDVTSTAGVGPVSRFFGWEDGRLLREAKDNKDDKKRGELSYYNGYFLGLKDTYDLFNVDGTNWKDASNAQFKGEYEDALTYLQSPIVFSHNTINETMLTAEPAWDETLPGGVPDGIRQPWEPYTGTYFYRGVTDPAANKKTRTDDYGMSGKFNWVTSAGTLSLGVGGNIINYTGKDLYFQFWPVIDSNTPDDLKQLVARNYLLLQQGLLFKEKASLSYSFPLFSLADKMDWDGVSFLSFLINKVNTGIDFTNTHTTFKTYDYYKYDELRGDLYCTSDNIKEHSFSSKQYTLPTSIETRTFAVDGNMWDKLGWPYSIYFSFAAGMDNSWLDRAPSIYSQIPATVRANDTYFGVPYVDYTIEPDPNNPGQLRYAFIDSDGDNVMDAGEKFNYDTSNIDYINTRLSSFQNLLKETSTLTSNDWWWSARVNLPFGMDIINLVPGLVNHDEKTGYLAYRSGSNNKKLNCSYSYKRIFGDQLINADSGMAGNVRGNTPVPVRYYEGDTNRNGTIDTGETWAYDDLNGNGIRDGIEQYKRTAVEFLGSEEVSENKPQDIDVFAFHFDYSPRLNDLRQINLDPFAWSILGGKPSDGGNIALNSGIFLLSSAALYLGALAPKKDAAGNETGPFINNGKGYSTANFGGGDWALTAAGSLAAFTLFKYTVGLLDMDYKSKDDVPVHIRMDYNFGSQNTSDWLTGKPVNGTFSSFTIGPEWFYGKYFVNYTMTQSKTTFGTGAEQRIMYEATEHTLKAGIRAQF